MSKVELIPLESIDGLMLEAAIHRAENPSVGTILLAHGITVTMDEDGMFTRLAERLAGLGFDVFRFSYRGHGQSGGTQQGMTIAGEMLDLQAAVRYVKSEFSPNLSIVASSFGAVSTCLSLPYIEKTLEGLVMWNPVLDLQKTFIHPKSPWAAQSFTEVSVEELKDNGFLMLDEIFKIGQVLYEEMKIYSPVDAFVQSNVPSFIIHPDRDSYTSYDISRDACQKKSMCDFHTIKDSDHGFDGREKEDEAIDETIRWLSDIYKV